MSYEDDDLALEEGRIALYQLERQLNDHRNSIVSDKLTENSVNSRQASLNSERKLLDQIPRDARLENRKGLGITVEKLDEKGLLDGGASIPSYNTSLKQKNRRRLEMKNRESRLRDREGEIHSKLFETLFHMIRTLCRRGFNIEEYFKLRDIQKQRLLDKKMFIDLLIQLGFPITNNTYDYIITSYFNQNNNSVDYYAFLKDCNIYFDKSNLSIVSSKINDFSNYINILTNIKDMLYKTMVKSNKSYDDIYRLFSRWDTTSTGEITTIQFLRELNNLEIVLNDLQQDYIVELLDISKIGQINFENLLEYIFTDNANINTNSYQFVSLSNHEKDNDYNQSVIRPITSNSNDNKSISRRSSDRLSNSPVVSKNNHLNIIKDLRQRPSTASGRVSSNSFSKQSKHISTSLQLDDDIVEDTVDGDDTLVSIDQDSALPNHISPMKRLSPLQTSKQTSISLNLSSDEPHDHLLLLAVQTLTTIREILLTNYRNGWSIYDIFKCFDKDKKGHIITNDFISTLVELKIELSEKVANISLSNIAINNKFDQNINQSNITNKDIKVYYGEFKVFMLDSEHKIIEDTIIKLFIQKYELIGQNFYNMVVNNNNTISNDLCSIDQFISYMNNLNIKMNRNELDRLIMRFSTIVINNNQINEYIYINKFINFIITNELWKRTTLSLKYQEESIIEANHLKSNLAITNSNNTADISLSHELLDMAAYLGIRPITESHLLWIANDALHAPLPTNWIIQKDKHNKNYFYNNVTHESRWDHPLDPHFRKLRDSFRFNSNHNQNNKSIQFNNFNSTLENTNDTMIFSTFEESPEVDSQRNLTYVQSAVSLPNKNEFELQTFDNQNKINSFTNNSPYNRPSSAPNRMRSNNKDDTIDIKNYDKIFNIDSTSYKQPIQLFDSKKYLTEVIYKAPYLATPMNTINEIINNVNNNPNQIQKKHSSVHLSYGMSLKSKQSTVSNSNKSKTNRPTSAVDRVVNVGKDTPSYQMPTKQYIASVIDPGSFKLPQTVQSKRINYNNNHKNKLAEMYDDNLIKRLDNIIVNSNSNKNNSSSQQQYFQNLVHSSKNKGGIVLI